MNRRNGYFDKILYCPSTSATCPTLKTKFWPIDDIYGFKLSAEQISKITDYVLDEQESWQNRTLAPFYPFLFVDCLFVPIKRDYKDFTAHLKKIYGAPSLKACRVEFERFCQVWAKYPDAIETLFCLRRTTVCGS